jgi:hypothetical protein
LWLTILAFGLAMVPADCFAQMIDNPTFGDFEINTAGSLEQDLLNQIRISGRVAPEDFPRLTRLIVLEASAMHQNVRADLRTTQIGANLEEQTLALFTSASGFDAYVRDSAGNLTFDSQEMRTRWSEILVEYRLIDSSLGQMPGFSPAAARHLAELTRLLSIVNAVVAPTASEAIAPPSSTPRTGNTAELERLNQRATALVAELERMELSRKNSVAPPASHLGEDRTILAQLITTFQRLLAAGPPMTDVVDAWRVIRARTWAFERRVRTQQDHPDWQTRWTPVRRRFDALSDELGLPRVIIIASSTAIVRPVDPKPIVSIDLCLESATKYLQLVNPPTSRDRTDAGIIEDLRQLQTKLLLVRISLQAGAPLTQSSALVSDLTAIGRSLRRRSQSKSRSGPISPPGSDEGMRELQRSLVRILEQIPN